ncbi:LTA synthase family protein [Tenuibacillus multivorans]|uniref:Phosphoglycerol transferase MdoB n=1 Tax=Tenuibacillus multivorans TaxID=237069 RepID=A0A1H0AKL0_9BACI|nr:LTA synthase family protein [Tenuibacillus multivorans]GEL78174.1 sulfatase [Tenuibacillus multivorans]SDN33663.1 Phosphoglycerol transferase MdoB [Tenuibacillus multivorans]
MNVIQKFTRLIGKFFTHYIDFILFVIIVTLKLFLFASLSGTDFAKQDFSGYLSELFNWIFSGDPESLTELRQGIVMVSIGAVLLVSFWVLMFPRRARILTFLSLDLVLSFIIFADMVYFRYFEDLISSAVLLQAGQVGALGDSISNLFSAIDWLFFVDILLFIPIVIYIFRKVPAIKTTKKNFITRIITTFMAFIVGYTLVFFPINVFIDKGGSYLFNKTLSNMRVYEKTGLLGFHGFDIYKYINQNILENDGISAQEKDDIQDWFEERQELAQQPTDLTGIAEDKNVIVLQLEAFENNLINQKIDGQEITPNLNKLVDQSLYFNNFYHQTAAGRTSDAEFLVNTSLYPMYTGSAYISYSGNSYTALPESLKEQGYSTSVFHAYKKSFWNRYLMYPSLGVDTFYSLDTFEKDDPLGWSISDKSMLRQSVEQMKDFEQPFYSMLITLTSHHPYDIPESYKELEIESIGDKTYRNYLQSAHYVDEAVGEFINLLKEEGLWEESVVVIYGDHDSALLKDEGETAEFLGYEDDQLGYHQNKEEVPLLIYLPNESKTGVYEQVGGQIDLGPTILDLVGIQPEERYQIGTSLFNEDDRLVVFRNGSFTTNELFYVASIDGVFENGTCYDTATGEETSLEACRPDYEKATKQLQMSDTVLRGDLIKEWTK